MTTTIYRADGRPLRLERRDFVAQGGEGRVYARDGRAWKLFTDPKRALTEAKMRALAGAWAHPGALAPNELVRDDAGAVIGHGAPFLADALPLCRLFVRSTRESLGVTPARALKLAADIAAVVRHAHAHGACVVDLSPLNVLVDAAAREASLIDCDSWQAEGFPATAVMDAVRDRHAPLGRFDAGTDWFAFAVTSFQLLIGVHPYRGQHPTVKGLDARMRGNLSVLRAGVKRPPACWPLDGVPPDLLAWYVSVFDRGFRGPPPPIAADDLPASAAVGVATAGQGDDLPQDALSGRWMRYDGRVYALTGDSLVELTRHVLGGRVVWSRRVLGRALPLATRFFTGVAVQDVLGATWLSAFPRTGAHAQLRVPELDGAHVVEARLDDHVVTFGIVGADGAERTLTLAIAPDLRGYAVVVP